MIIKIISTVVRLSDWGVSTLKVNFLSEREDEWARLIKLISQKPKKNITKAHKK